MDSLTPTTQPPTAQVLPLAVRPRKMVGGSGYRTAMSENWQRGFIFTCRSDTFLENFQYGVFGMPAHKLDLLREIEPEECALFLFDSSARYLHGVFESASSPGLNLCPDYLKKRTDLHTSESGSPFPAQVKFRLVHEFEPLSERRFCHALSYVHKTNTFKQKLTSYQVAELLRLLDDPASAPVAKELPYETNGYRFDPSRLPSHMRRP